MAYVYALIDPRTEKPFYIGKGSRDDRPKRHFGEALSGGTSIKCNVINKIIKLGKDIKIIKSDKLSDEEAFEIEIMLIEEFGRRDNQTGCLTNMTDGGEGTIGWKHTEESLSNLSKAMKGREVTEENKERLREELMANPLILRDGVKEKVSGENHWCFGKEHPSKGKKIWTEEGKRKLSEMAKAQVRQPASEETKEKLRQVHLGRKVSDTSKFHWERKRVACPHCDKEGSVSNMKRWHFSNCKELRNAG